MLTTILPESKTLQRYIDLFYLFEPKTSKSWRHIAFPHVNTGLSFLQNATIERGDYQVLINESVEKKVVMELLGKYTRPVFVSCEGQVNEVAIVFKPLGVSRFIREDFGRIATGFSQPYMNSDWQNVAEEIFTTRNQIGFLEQFLLSQLCDDEQFVRMEDALAMLGSAEHDFTVAEVAREMNMTQKTFQRQFSKMLACSPSDYKRIARFRNAINSKLKPGAPKTLTSISYEHNYTDQSYLIKEFKKMTNQNPRLFFKELSIMGENKIIWEIL